MSAAVAISDTGVAYIISTNGYRIRVDSNDYAWLSQWRWVVIRNHPEGKWKSKLYAARKERLGDKWVNIFMHREIMGLPAGVGVQRGVVDHRDDDGLNNVRDNLRVVSNSTNLMRKRRRSDNTSGHPGVRYNPDSGTWTARIRKWVDGRQITIFRRTVRTREEAIAAHDSAMADLLARQLAAEGAA